MLSSRPRPPSTLLVVLQSMNARAEMQKEREPSLRSERDPQNSYVEILIPKGVGVRRQGLWEALGS